jgi:hypothetical protein
MEAIVQAHSRFAEELHKAGKMVQGERLRPDSDGIRVRFKAGQRQVMDGPFTETKEALGGFYLIECETRDEAIEWAKKVPLREGAFVDVRPIWSMWEAGWRCSLGPRTRACGTSLPEHARRFEYHLLVESMDRGQMLDSAVHTRVAEVFRQECGRVVASVLRIVRDIDAAEEVTQEAFEQALEHWPANGTPDRPGAWLLTTARRRALDRLRRTRRAGARAEAWRTKSRSARWTKSLMW